MSNLEQNFDFYFFLDGPLKLNLLPIVNPQKNKKVYNDCISKPLAKIYKKQY